MFEEAFSLNDFTIDRTRQPYHTIIVDLVRPLDVIRKQLDQKWRNQLNQSEKHNLQITTDGSADSFSAFLGLYDEMKGNKGFETSVNEREFERMQDQLPSSQKMQVFLARENGLAIGGLVCSRLGDTVIYLLGATIGRARELKAAYLLHWCAIKWFREQGALCYDLGGVDLKTNPGGHHFKSGFKGNEMTHLPPHACSPGVVGTVIQSVSGFLRNGFRGRG